MREMNTNITLEETHKQFTVPVQTLFYMSHRPYQDADQLIYFYFFVTLVQYISYIFVYVPL